MSNTRGSYSAKLAHECLSLQLHIAAKLCSELNCNRVYVFDISNYFKDAPILVSPAGFRYALEWGNYAVLSQAAQAVLPFDDPNVYVQIVNRKLGRDHIGLYYTPGIGETAGQDISACV